MALTRLTDGEIAARLEALPEWSQPGEEIQRTFRFADFNAAMAFVETVAEHAERVQHHPDILIRYSRVTLSLSTHDANGITEKDFEFAAYADGLATASGVKA
jgi:4a-hydroxytetrahydrobiopterin dehydratase